MAPWVAFVFASAAIRFYRWQNGLHQTPGVFSFGAQARRQNWHWFRCIHGHRKFLSAAVNFLKFAVFDILFAAFLQTSDRIPTQKEHHRKKVGFVVRDNSQCVLRYVQVIQAP